MLHYRLRTKCPKTAGDRGLNSTVDPTVRAYYIPPDISGNVLATTTFHLQI